MTVCGAPLRVTILLLVAVLIWRSFRAVVLGSSEWAIYISSVPGWTASSTDACSR